MLGLVAAALAQEDFPRVYAYDQPMAGWTELALWTTGVAASDGRWQHFGADAPRAGLLAHAGEVEVGVTDHLALGGYVDLEDAPGEPVRFTQGRLLARVRFANRQDAFVNPGVYLEGYLPRRAYADPEIEARIVLDKDLEDFRVAVNPRASVRLAGAKAGEVEPALDAGVTWRRWDLLQPGLEYHGTFGGGAAHVVEPTLDVGVAKQVTWHLGAAIGVGGDADALLVQSVVTVEADVVRPSRLFGHGG